jgi:hypothetical protein
VPARPEQPDASEAAATDEPRVLPPPSPCCGGPMFVIESFARGCEPKHRPTPAPATTHRFPLVGLIRDAAFGGALIPSEDVPRPGSPEMPNL